MLSDSLIKLSSPARSGDSRLAATTGKGVVSLQHRMVRMAGVEPARELSSGDQPGPYLLRSTVELHAL
jgi:hypothetical protein